MRFETKAIRTQLEKTQHREHSSPMFLTSSFVFDDVDQMQGLFAGTETGNIYSRFTNPSVREFESKLEQLEGGDRCVAFASGMAAIFASFMALLREGDHILATRATFGSSLQVIESTLPNYGISYTFIDTVDVDEWEQLVQPNTKLLFIETPSNPGLQLIDIAQASDFANAHDMVCVVDNCFATPYLQRPIELGAHLVVHSATKYIDGQGRVLGGAVVGNQELVDQIFQFNRRTGASLSPFNAWVLSKSLETLAVRMDRHCSSALTLANILMEENQIKNIRYPHLPSFSQYDLAKKQLDQGGGILTFEITHGSEKCIRFLNNLKMISLTANLGDTRTIASHPASTTHLRIGPENRQLIGITENMIRLSVGLEHVDDILQDIQQALNS